MKPRKFFDLIDLDLNNLAFYIDSSQSLDINKFDINPEEFLEFAKKDIENNSKHGLVNSLSNSKRAIDCQIEKILSVLGLSNPGNFPKKADCLQRIGVATPKIIRKIIRYRNSLEHDFSCPTKGQTEDAIDIAELFLESTNGKLKIFPDRFIMGSEKDIFSEKNHFKNCIWVKFGDDKFNLKKFEDEKTLECNIKIENKKCYIKMLQLAFETGKYW